MTAETFVTSLVLLSLLGLLVGLLERTHRRASASPSAFRPDAVAGDADLRRLRDDLSARAASAPEAPVARGGGQGADEHHRVRPVRLALAEKDHAVARLRPLR